MIYSNLQEARKAKVIAEFFKKFGRLPIPACFACSRKKGSQKKVDQMGVDYDDLRDEIIVFVKCHGDVEECRAPSQFVMQQEGITIQWAFHPKSSTRIEGKMVRRPT